MMPTQRFSSVVLLLLLFNLARAEDEIEALVAWIKSLGGYIHPSQVIRTENPDDPSSLRGIFATADIAKDELLLDLPVGAIIGPDPANGDTMDHCGTVRAVKRELQLGDESSFAPYVRVLNYTVSLPDSYSEGGKNMLRKVVGPYLEPQRIGGHLAWWSDACKGDLKNDELGANAALLTVARACASSDSNGTNQHVMAPFWGLYNHRNGWYTNIRAWTKFREHFEVYASRKIYAGEQLYYSYGAQTPNILSHYGFVEELPQEWIFNIPASVGTVQIAFGIDEDTDGNRAFSWLYEAKPSNDEVNFLKFYEQNRLNSIEAEVLCQDSGGSCPDGIPPHEMAVISRYYRALKSAIDSAVAVAEAAPAAADTSKSCEL